MSATSSKPTANTAVIESRDRAPRKGQPFEAKKFDLRAVTGLSQDALEVHLSLYAGYVKETNALQQQLDALALIKELSPAERLQSDGLVRRQAFEYDGMVLHELFFESLTGPGTKLRSDSVFMHTVESSYGSFEAWKNDVSRLAQTRGVGWVLTLFSEADRRIRNVWIDDHTRGLLANHRLILAFDIWEHAFLLDFKPSERPQYLQTLFENINWKVIEDRCQ